MSHQAIFDTSEALRARIEQVIPGQVHIGAPVKDELGESRVSLFLFHLQVNPELRNVPYFPPPAVFGAVADPAAARDAVPWDLRFLVTAFRSPADARSPNELTLLGQIMQELHTRPTLSGSALGGQMVRVTPEPYPMEEISRVWGLYANNAYRTSIVYLASPVFVEARPEVAGPRVQRREQHTGVAADPPDLLGASE